MLLIPPFSIVLYTVGAAGGYDGGFILEELARLFGR
jgi:hypothetical protein